MLYFVQGEKKQTNYHRVILSELVRGILPKGWTRYTVPRGCTVIQWITDFTQRVKQLEQVYYYYFFLINILMKILLFSL